MKYEKEGKVGDKYEKEGGGEKISMRRKGISMRKKEEGRR